MEKILAAARSTRTFARKTMISRTSGTLAALCSSFALLTLFDLLAESLNDGLSDTPVSPALFLVDAFAPIGWLEFVLPLGVALLYWTSQRNTKDLSWLVCHGLSILWAYLFLATGILISAHLIYLNGAREVTMTRIIGNGTLLAVLGFGLFEVFRRQRSVQQASDGNAEKPPRAGRTQ